MCQRWVRQEHGTVTYRNLERFQAKWIPVRVKKTRQNKKIQPRSDSIGTEKALAQHLFRFRHGAEHVIERRRRYGGHQRAALAVKLVVPAAGDGMAEIMPLQPRQRRARL